MFFPEITGKQLVHVRKLFPGNYLKKTRIPLPIYLQITESEKPESFRVLCRFFLYRVGLFSENAPGTGNHHRFFLNNS